MSTSAAQPARNPDPWRKPLSTSRTGAPRAKPALRVVGGTPEPPVWQRMRCECRRCGVHVVTNVGYTVAGECANCGSYELSPISPA